MNESLHYLTEDETPRLSEPNSDVCENFDVDNKVLGDIKDLGAVTDTKNTEDIDLEVVKSQLKEMLEKLFSLTFDSPSLSASESSVINTSLVVSPCLGSTFVICDEAEYESKNCTPG